MKYYIKRGAGELLFDFINVAVMLTLIVLMLYPFMYVVLASVSDPYAMIKHRGLLFAPIGRLTMSAYEAVFKNPDILTGYRNTLLYVAVGTSVNMIMTILGAYVLSRRGYKLKRFFSLMVVFTMFFDGGLIPFYIQVSSYGIANTMWAVILPYAMTTYNLILMRTAFAAMPQSLEESARIDGANDLYIMWRIVVPLNVPIIAVVALYYIVGHWNSWFRAMVFLRDRNKYPLQIFLREILALSDTGRSTAPSLDRVELAATIRYATIIVSTLPVLMVYPFLQRYFIKGIMLGAIKE